MVTCEDSVMKDKKTKVLVASDIHGDKKVVDNLVKKARSEKVDLVILAGDLTLEDEDSDDIIAPFSKIKIPVLLLHGNHESISTVDFLSELYPEAVNLHGYSFSRGDLGIFGCGGADFGVSVDTDDGVFNSLSRAHKKIKGLGKKIMVTHMHAFDTDAEFSGFRGSKGVRKAIEKFKPDIFLSGHIHEAEGLKEKIGKTTIYSVGKKGKIVEL